LVTKEALIPKKSEVFGPNTKEHLKETQITSRIVPEVKDQTTSENINIYSGKNIKELVKE
jgi:hypothetical protein